MLAILSVVACTYSGREEWVEFYNESEAIKCNNQMRKIITKWATIAIQAGY